MCTLVCAYMNAVHDPSKDNNLGYLLHAGFMHLLYLLHVGAHSSCIIVYIYSTCGSHILQIMCISMCALFVCVCVCVCVLCALGICIKYIL